MTQILENIVVKDANLFADDELKANGITFDDMNLKDFKPFDLKIYDANDKVNPKVTELSMYEPLRKGFQDCIDRAGVPLVCLDTHSLREELDEDLSLDAKAGPDLLITFKGDKYGEGSGSWGPTLFYCPGIVVEVKRNFKDDPNLSEDPSQEIQYSRAQVDLCDQINRYVSLAQFPSNPCRYIYSITVTGHKMRLWKWTATGVVVSESFLYKEKEEVLPLYKLFAAITSRSGLGLNWRTTEKDDKSPEVSMADAFRDRMEFTEYQWKQEHSEKLDFLIPKYASWRGVPPEKGWAKVMKTSFMWQIGVYESTKEHLPPIVYLVFKHPIWRAANIVSRGTKVYICIEKKFFEAMKIESVTDEDILKKTKTLKTSWPFLSRDAEATYFNDGKVKELYKESEFCLPRLFSSAEAEDRAQSRGKFMTVSEAERLKDGVARRACWHLFDGVGTELTNFTSTKELIDVLRQCLRTHNDLFTKANILHRDISLDNILIQVSPAKSGDTRRGMLIDLDYARTAKDLAQIYKISYNTTETQKLDGAPPSTGRKTPRPDLTGTVRYMAIALDNWPLHRDWHDYESFYWILIFCAVRHIKEVKIVWSYFYDGVLEISGVNNNARREALNAIFRDRGTTERLARKQCTAGKLDFILNAKLKFSEDYELERLVNKLTVMLRKLYMTLGAVSHLQSSIQQIREEFAQQLREFKNSKWPNFAYGNSYAVRDKEDLKGYAARLTDFVGKLKEYTDTNPSLKASLATLFVQIDLEITNVKFYAGQLEDFGYQAFSSLFQEYTGVSKSKPVPYDVGRDDEAVVIIKPKPKGN